MNRVVSGGMRRATLWESIYCVLSPLCVCGGGGRILLFEGGYDFWTLSSVSKSLDSDCEIIPSWTPECHRILRTKVWKYDFGQRYKALAPANTGP